MWGLPARRSLADDPAFAAQGEDVVAFFKFFDALTRNPETRLISAQAASFDQYMPRLWLFRAFDRYVLDNAELEPQLNEAEMFTKAYLDCTASLPKSPEGTTQAELTAFYRQFTDCAVKIDPTIKPVVSPQQ